MANAKLKEALTSGSEFIREIVVTDEHIVWYNGNMAVVDDPRLIEDLGEDQIADLRGRAAENTFILFKYGIKRNRAVVLSEKESGRNRSDIERFTKQKRSNCILHPVTFSLSKLEHTEDGKSIECYGVQNSDWSRELKGHICPVDPFNFEYLEATVSAQSLYMDPSNRLYFFAGDQARGCTLTGKPKHYSEFKGNTFPFRPKA